jgi:hypothetical protein
MTLTRKWFIAALIATPLVAFFVYASLNWYQWVERPHKVGLSDEAKKNPFLALGRLLQRMGAKSEFALSPVQLTRPPEKGVLVLANRRLAFMTPQRVREIDVWVRRGGLLVAEAEMGAIDDPLLELYGIEREVPSWMKKGSSSSRKREAEKEKEKEKEGAKASGKRADPVATIAWPGAERPLRVRQWGSGMRIGGEGEPEQLLTSVADNRLVFVSFAAGQGRVVFLSDFGFLRNGGIGDHDHAEFAWRLITNAPEPRTAMLFLRIPNPSLLAWMRENAWPVIVAGIVLVLLWLGRIVPRFGPLEPEAPPVRRSLLEHLRAAGRFVWARGEAKYLLDAVRDRVWRTAMRRRGGLKGLADSKAEETLAALTHSTGATVRQALRGDGRDPAAFMQTAGALQSLERGLAHRLTNDSKKKGAFK